MDSTDKKESWNGNKKSEVQAVEEEEEKKFGHLSEKSSMSM